MWGLARLLVVAAMLVCACGTTSSDVTPPSPAVVPLARVDGWPLEPPAGEPATNVIVAYDAAAGRRVWAAARTADGLAGSGPVQPSGVSGDLDGVDFARQVVLVLETAGSSSCPRSVVDVRATTGGAVAVTTATDAVDHSCTADLHAYTEILAVDRDRLPAAGALSRTPVLVDGARAARVSVVRGT